MIDEDVFRYNLGVSLLFEALAVNVKLITLYLVKLIITFIKFI